MKIEISNSEKESLLKTLTDDRIYRTACFDSIALISNRIQQKGQKSDESKIGNGTYSKQYAKKRDKNGRQTRYVDLTFTGEMIDGLSFEKTSDNEYSVGFSSQKSAEKAEWNEARFGIVFELSDNELDLVKSSIEDNLNEAIRG